MDTLEERIRRKAYELWEAAGQTGSPEDHWLAAERELQNMQDHSEATFEDVPPDRTLGSGRSAECGSGGSEAEWYRGDLMAG
jgi:hypothetical protein